MKNYFDGIASQEDVENAVEAARSVMGPDGRYLAAGKNVTLNAVLMTKPHGKLWYGDVSMADFEKLEQLAKTLKTAVGVYLDGTHTMDSQSLVFVAA